MVAMASLLKVEDVNVDTVHMGNVVPKLGLVSNAELKFRVYVLECAPLGERASRHIMLVSSTRLIWKRG